MTNSLLNDLLKKYPEIEEAFNTTMNLTPKELVEHLDEIEQKKKEEEQ